MFFQCLGFLASAVGKILALHIPGTTISFLQLALGLAFLPVLINVFARIFGGTIGVDTAIKTARKIEESHNSNDDDA